MRRMRAILGVLVCALVLAPTALAAGRDTVTVTGEASQGLFPSIGGIDIHASSGPRGQGARGSVTFFTDSFVTYTGKVTCMRVEGNTAILNFRGTVTDYFTGAFIRRGIYALQFVDNGGAPDIDGYGTDTIGFGGPYVGQDCRPVSLQSYALALGRAVVVDMDR